MKHKPHWAKGRVEDIPKYILKEDVDKILNAVKDHPRDHLFINILWRTGGRVSEILNLKPSDIDYRMKTIKLITLKQRIRDKIPIRTVPIHQELIDEIDMYIKSNKIKREDRIFPITRQCAHLIIRKIFAKVGLDMDLAHPHTFRHSFAIHCMINKTPDRTLQKWLGHSSTASLEIYTQILGQDTSGLMEQIKF